MNSEKMARVSSENPCPVCQKPDWCLVVRDGSAAICQRIEQGSVKRCGEAGYLHILVERPEYPRHRRLQRTFTVGNNSKPNREFAALQRQYGGQITGQQIHMLGQRLGVSIDSLKRLSIGWDGGAYTFPMRDSKGQIVGFRRRFLDGRKLALTGSKAGLFIPTPMSDTDPLIVCEGPTDAAAGLDLGFAAIGRPNCNSGVEMTVRFVKGRAVVIVGDNDITGRAGAERLGTELLLHCPNVKVIYPPDTIKDLRQWFRAGLTGETLCEIIEITEPAQITVSFGEDE